jgi:hypothetical protein
MEQSGIAQWEIQAYLYADLKLDAVLGSLCPGGVHDMQAPPTADYPYLVIGDWTESNSDMQATVARQLTITLHAWDNYEGSKNIKLIMNRVAEIIDRRPFATDNWFVNVAYLEYVNNMRSPDNKQHGIIRFRFKQVTRRS